MNSKIETPSVSQLYAPSNQVPHRNANGNGNADGNRNGLPKPQTANRRSTCPPPSAKPGDIDHPVPGNQHPPHDLSDRASDIENPPSTIHDRLATIQDRASNIQHPVSRRQSPAPGARRVPKRIRHGKIARLPYLERDMVNRMLRDHIPYKMIVDALDEHGIRVTERNVSNWKTRGGYDNWRVEQDRALENRLAQDNLLEHVRKTDATQLPEIGLQIAATNLSQFFLKPEIQNRLSTTPGVCHQTIADLCRLSRHLHALQKYRDESAKELGQHCHPERIRRAEENSVETTRAAYSAAEIADQTFEPIPRRNFIAKSLAPEPRMNGD